MNLIPDFFNFYQKPILNQWGKIVLKPKYELHFQNGYLIRKSHVEKTMIDFFPVNAMENKNSKDIGYEIHIFNITNKTSEGHDRTRTINNLMVNKIGTNGCYLMGSELNKQTEVKIFKVDNETVFLKIINDEGVIVYLEDENQLKNIDSLINVEIEHTFNYKSMYDFVKATSVHHKAYFCNNCNNLEYGFGLTGSDGNGGKCIHCKKNVSKHDKFETLIFSLEILNGILKYFDNYENNSFNEKQQLIQEIESFINSQYKKNGKIDESKIILIQAIIKSMQSLMGGKNEGPIITLKNGTFGYAHDKDISVGATNSFFHTLAIILMCLLYIDKYETKNEYVLDSRTDSSKLENNTHLEKGTQKKSFWNKLFNSNG